MADADQTVTVRIPLVFRKHGGRKTVISPDGETWEPKSPLVDSALVKALARAFRWRRMLDEGVYGTFDELAEAERVSQSYVSRVLRLTLVEAVLDGRQPDGMRLEDLLAGMPLDWARQPCRSAPPGRAEPRAPWDCVARGRTPQHHPQAQPAAPDAQNFDDDAPSGLPFPRPNQGDRDAV